MMPNWYRKILDQFHKDRNTEAYYKTQGFGKLWSYFQAVLDKDDFQAAILSLRRKYNIPIQGYSNEGKDSWSRPPKEWQEQNMGSEAMIEINSKIRELCSKYGLLYRDWGDIIDSYLFFNIPYISPQPAEKNLCVVSDGHTQTDSRGSHITKEVIDAYPVGLHLSAYASKRDILDYIERLYTTEIAPLQKRYQKPEISIGAHKKRDGLLRRRDDFIYKNKDLPRKELVKLVGEKFPTVSRSVDEGSVGKIISVENKRRK